MGLVLLAINLRPAIGSVSPLLSDVQRDLGLSGAAVSVLTTLPVLCLGLFATIAPALARRVGVGRALVLALALIVIGLLVRLAPAVFPLFLGTLLAGVGLAIGNVLVPAVIKTTFPTRIRLYTGISTALLSGGAALSSGVTVPLREAFGTNWSTSLALWAVPAVLALVVWLVLAARSGKPTAAAAAPSVMGALLRDATAWQATVYLALRALAFFTALGWLPTVLVTYGYGRAEAGAMLSLVMLVSIPAAVLAPVFAGKVTPRPVIVLIVLLGAVSNLGLVIVPDAVTLWAVLLGVALGGGFAMAMTFIGLRSPDPATAAQLSGMVQTIGYLVGAVGGPFAFGLLNTATGGWTVPLVVAAVLTVPELVVGLLVSRDRQVLQPAPRRAAEGGALLEGAATR
ncbi:MFS transporter [Saccharothrix syringae]|uniref:MFS transporter n=1 Tax=Saccharothrix syringae TaxID=103733 RepID=A0A5Q0HEY3_SACSY|nr:MFS transporter [Saccharothrix syringae]